MIIFRQKYADHPDESKNILKTDKELRDRLRPEDPGILQILIDQCLECVRLKGLKMPQTVRETTDQYLDDQNTLVQWASRARKPVPMNWGQAAGTAQGRLRYSRIAKLMVPRRRADRSS